MDMRKTIIDILLATRSLPEGVAADAIISAIGSGAEPVGLGTYYEFAGRFGGATFDKDDMDALEKHGPPKGLQFHRLYTHPAPTAQDNEACELADGVISRIVDFMGVRDDYFEGCDVPPVPMAIEALEHLIRGAKDTGLAFDVEENDFVVERDSKVPEGWKLGNLVTVSSDEYPGMGEWFVQIWAGDKDSDPLIARCYGNNPEEARRHAEILLSAAPTAQDSKELSEALHYPECWDTVAYPTLHSALLEVAACSDHPAQDSNGEEDSQ